MYFTRFFIFFVFHLLIISSVYGQKFMGIDDVRPGMRGYGLTVFQNSKIDTFEVEVLGVMRNTFYTNHNIVMVSLSGPYVDDAGVIAGMSGSPVYINQKLVGALAYRFGQFPQKPIGGITPISQMLAIREFLDGEEKSDQNRPDKIFNSNETNNNSFETEFSVALDKYSSLDSASHMETHPVSHSIKPIAVPLVFSGFHPMTVNLFENEMRRRGLVPISGSGSIGLGNTFAMHGGKSDSHFLNENQKDPAAILSHPTLLPGSAVSAQLIRGDFNLSGTGTVTWRDEDAILAFGHPFLWAGALDIPMTQADIITIIPDQAGSTKISSVAAEVGSVVWDHTDGLYGKLGNPAQMIPVKLSYSDFGRSLESYHFDVMMAKGWTPMLVNMAVTNSILTNGWLGGERTINISGQIVLKDYPSVVFEDQFSGQTSMAALAREVSNMLNFVIDNRFMTPILDSIEIEIGSLNQRKTAVIEDVWFSSDILTPGDILEVSIFLKPYRGNRVVKKLKVPIPKNISAGSIQVLIGSATAVTRHDLNTVPQRYRPADGARLIELLNNRRTRNGVYLKIYQDGSGGILKGREMPGLPPSVLAVMQSERTKGSFVPIREKVVVEREIKTDFVIDGQKWSRLIIKR